MNDREKITIDDVINAIYESLNNAARRKIIVALANEGPLAFKDLMRKCNIKDSGTLNYHLERMKPLVTKDDQGLYKLTRIGRLAYESMSELKSKVELILPYIRGVAPILMVKPSIIPLITHLIVMIIVVFAILRFLSEHPLNLINIIIITALIIPLTAGLLVLLKRCLSTYIIKHDTIVERTNLLLAHKEKFIQGKIIGVSVSRNIFTNIFNYVNITLTLKSNGEIVTVKIPYVRRSSDIINSLIARKYD